MKKINHALILTSLLALSLQCSASPAVSTLIDNSANKFYWGGNVGQSYTDIPTSRLWNVVSGLGYNFHAGYMFNETWGAELGYTHYADATLSTYFGHSLEGLSLKYQQSSINMLAKGVYHLTNPRWSMYGKAGLAFLNTNLQFNVPATDSTIPTPATSADLPKQILTPLVGIGFSYEANQTVSFNVGWDELYHYDTANSSVSLLYFGVDFR